MMCATSMSGLTRLVLPATLSLSRSSMALVRIKGVKAYVSNGKAYAYHRKTGKKLRSIYGSAEFLAELAEIERKYQQGRGRVEAAKPGTWAALVVGYKEHRLPQLGKRTQTDYHKVLDWLSVLDGMPLSNWSRGFAIKLRDKAFKQRGRRFANYVISVVQAVFSWGLEREYVIEHPVQNVKAIERPKGMERANRPWARSEWDVVIAEAPKHLLAPILLCGVLGWREGEAVNRPRNDYNRDSKRIKRTSAKSGKIVKTPVPKLVSDALDALFPHGAVTLLVNSRGTSWTENGFRSSVFKFLGRLEGRGKVGAGLTIHGLRHTCGTLLRELGFDKDTIADMLGQEDAGMAEWYARDADLERKLVGVVREIDRHLMAGDQNIA
jgi:integrase